MGWVEAPDARLYVETDGDGEPVSVLAHGLGNNRLELAMLTPFLPGTKVRFDFRGHGRSVGPMDPAAYRFADFAGDLDAVAAAYGARIAVGTSLGAGAIANLLVADPDRFDRSLWLLPAGLDRGFAFVERYDRLADSYESAEEAIEAVDADPERVRELLRAPWMEGLGSAMWEHEDLAALGRAIRCVVRDHPVEDREALRRVEIPVLIICMEGDPIHPAELGRILHGLLPNSELLVYPSGEALVQAIPDLVPKVATFLSG